MKLYKQYLTQNDCYTTGATIKPRGVMVHSTGANNPTLRRYVGPNDGRLGQNRYNNHWNRPGIKKCAHAFIGELADGSVATYQTLPWNYCGWHCGGSANNTHISFEICEDSLTDARYFKAVYQEAVELTAYLCKKYGLDPLADGVVICHSEGHARGIASNHGDVLHWFPRHGKSMDDFRADVAELVRGNTPSPTPISYKVKVIADALNIRSGAGTKNPVVGVIRDKGVYTLVDEMNGWGLLKSGAGWISLAYVRKL